MTGPEHYKEAERLLEQAATQRREVRERVANFVEKRDKEREVDIADGMAAVTIAAAQVHATLALAAATAEAGELVSRRAINERWDEDAQDIVTTYHETPWWQAVTS